MYNSDTEILFPSRLIPSLIDLRGEAWHSLVERVIPQEALAQDRLAFVLLMVRLSSCASCHADSFRAIRGCSRCAYLALRHFRGTDQDLVQLFMEARHEVEKFLGLDLHLEGKEEQLAGQG